MSSTPRRDIASPPSIASCFAAATIDGDTVAGAVVEAATTRYHYTSEPLPQEIPGGEPSVTARVAKEIPA